MWHKPCRTFHPWCLCIKTRCLSKHWSHIEYHGHIWRVSLQLICGDTCKISSLFSGSDVYFRTLQWRHNGCDGFSNHPHLDYLVNRLFIRRSKKHQSSASLAFVRGIYWWTVNSPYKGPVTRKMFPFDDVIMKIQFSVTEKLTNTAWE